MARWPVAEARGVFVWRRSWKQFSVVIKQMSSPIAHPGARSALALSVKWWQETAEVVAPLEDLISRASFLSLDQQEARH